MNSVGLIVDIIGWAGAIFLLYAYARVSSGSLSGQSTLFQLLNVAGSICFIINSGYHEAYPSVFVNIVWAGIALRVLGKNRREGPLNTGG